MVVETILGISLGTRIVGLAVINKGELIEWKVKTFSEKWSSEKRKAILQIIGDLCSYYHVKLLSIKKPDPLRSSHELNRLLINLTKQAKRQKIRTRLLSLAELDYDLRTGKRQTKRDLSERVAERHPEVRQEYIKERNNRKEYYTKMFEAIALAENIGERSI